MSTAITTLVMIAFLFGLTYIAKDIVTRNKESREPKEPLAPETGETVRSIATRDELLRFWTEVMNDNGLETDLRLKASELLGMFHFDDSARKG